MIQEFILRQPVKSISGLLAVMAFLAVYAQLLISTSCSHTDKDPAPRYAHSIMRDR